MNVFDKPDEQNHARMDSAMARKNGMKSNDIFERMITEHNNDFEEHHRNALHEVTQQIALPGLYRDGFFDKAAFYGDTCLRIIHGLNRYSEDMDFSLLNKDESFNIED